MTNNQQRDTVDEAFAAILQLDIPDCPSDTALLERLSIEVAPGSEKDFPLRNIFGLPTSSILTRSVIWSSTAAALCVVCAVLLFSSPTSVVLADVVKAAEKHKLVRYAMTHYSYSKDGSSVRPLVSVVYADLKLPRSRQENEKSLTLNEWVEHECFFVTDVPKNLKLRVVTEVLRENGIEIYNRDKTESLSENLKNSGRFPRKEASITTANGDFTPATTVLEKSMLENIQDLEEHKEAIATKSKLEGKDVLKYRIEEEFKTTVLTVDSVTKLPLKLEHEITDPNILHRTQVKIKIVLSDFEWDPDLKDRTLDELFDTTPPNGYAVVDHRK